MSCCCGADIFWALFAILISCFVYHFIIKTWWYFERRNIVYYRGWPLFGSMYRSVLGLQSEAENITQIHRAFPNERFIGFYDMFGQPSYFIRDPDLLKKITITDFDHFVNHLWHFDEDIDPMLGRSLFSIRDEQWRRMRTTLSPAFTGNKMRLMHKLMLDTTNEFITSLRADVTNDGKEFDIKEVYQRYASDVIASCAFGIKMNSYRDADSEFYRAGMEISNFSGWMGFKLFAWISAPRLMKLLKLKLFTDEVTNFFRRTISSNFAQREKDGIVRNDMIDLLIKVKNGTLSSQNETEDDNQDSFVQGTDTKYDDGALDKKTGKI